MPQSSRSTSARAVDKARARARVHARDPDPSRAHALRERRDLALAHIIQLHAGHAPAQALIQQVCAAVTYEPKCGHAPLA